MAKIGVSNPTFDTWALDELLETVEENFDFLEMVSEGEHHFAKMGTLLSDLLPSYDVEVQLHAPFSDVNLASVNERMWEASKDEIRDAVDWSVKMGIDLVTVHPGTLSPATFSRYEKAMGRAREAYKELLAHAENVGVTLAMENMPEMPVVICKTPEELDYVADGGPVCIDVGNAVTTSTMEEYMSRLKSAANVHLHDNNGKEDNHWTLGEGVLDLDILIPELMKRPGPITIEIKNMDSAIASKKVIDDYR